MALFETAYKSLLQGVSQQPPESRLPGQVTAQLNMQSDPMTNLRRRQGFEYVGVKTNNNATTDNIKAFFMDVAGAEIHVIVNTTDGRVSIYDIDWVEESGSPLQNNYLKATDPYNIRVAPVGNELFIANLEKTPSATNSNDGLNPKHTGFFYVLAGAFSKDYSVSINRVGKLPYTVTYTTPDGTGVGDAAKATPEYIADQIKQGIESTDAHLNGNVYIDGPYVYIENDDDIVVNSSTGKNYLIASKASAVLDVGELPARLPDEGDGYNCRVGAGDFIHYYRYVKSSGEWVEVGEYGGPTAITNCPISLYWTGSAWALNTSNFVGRFAGDETTNPTHEWVTYGLTGIGTYQGRFVILSGPMVSLSASNKPRNFYRSTVSSVVNSDPIEVGSNANSSAAYEWCLPFQKDLILFSNSHQAVLPSGNTGVTPATATVVPTSGFAVDTTSSPIIVGRTIMYSKPRSQSFFGIMEMVPSSYTDSQYTSLDVTPHLPRYFGGRCRFSVSSSTASVALFAPSGDKNTLIVHEYHWEGDEKVQQAWHQWTFPYEVAQAYFTLDVVTLLFVKDGKILIGTMDPRQGVLGVGGEYITHLDNQTTVSYSNNTIAVPADWLSFDADIKDNIIAVVGSGDSIGELIKTTYDSGNLITDISHPDGDATIGIPFESSVVLTPPIMVDESENPIYTGKITALRFMINTTDSGAYKLNMSDGRSGNFGGPVPVLSFDSTDLELGTSLVSSRSTALLPARTDARTTRLELHTDTADQMNIQSVEYVLRMTQRFQRR